MSDRPAFSAPLYAAVRQGAKELSQVLPAFPESAHVVEEPGTIGNLPSQVVTREMGLEKDYNAMRYEDVKQQYASRGQEISMEDREIERE